LKLLLFDTAVTHMNNLYRFFAGLGLAAILFLAQPAANAQDKTIILVRHAERASNVPTEPDPDLSAEGRARAEAFRKAAKRYRPGAVFSTNYKRTRETAGPIAKHRGKEIQIYDANKQSELVDTLIKSKTKRFVVVGHSNTIPPLANLLAKKEIFRNLLDSEYGVYYVVRVRNGIFRKIEVRPF
jgi:2,3-bisphosphoglycerate-dependent phosphoglycerate mutase